MKFKEYLEQLNTYAVEHPEALELNVVKEDGWSDINTIHADIAIGYLKFGFFIINNNKDKITTIRIG